MDESTLNQESLKLDLQNVIAETRQHQLAPFERYSLAWLALVPAWTEQLAIACQFPSGETSLSEFLERAEAAGLCSRSPRENIDKFAAWKLALTFVNLVRHLLEPQHIIQVALQAARSLESQRLQSQALATLASRLAVLNFSERALEVAQSIQDERLRSRALTALASSLPESLLFEVLETAQAIANPSERVTLLTKLLPYLSKSRQERVIQEILALALKSDDPGAKTRQLSEIIPILNQLLASQTINLTAPALFFLPRLPAVGTALFGAFLGEVDKTGRLGAVVNQALEAARTIEDPGERVRGLINLVPYLSESTKEAIIQEALKSTQATEDPEDKAQLLSEITRLLAQSGERRWVITIADQALEAVRVLSSTPRVAVLLSVAKSLNEVGKKDRLATVANQALKAARKLKDMAEQVTILINLIPYWSRTIQREIIQEALRKVEQITHESDRATALVGLIPYLEGETKENTIEQALKILQSVEDDRQFWMSCSTSADVLEYIRQSYGTNFLHQITVDAGNRIIQVQQQGKFVSAAVSRWAKLASRTSEGLDAAARWLTEQIRTLIKNNDTGQALAWVNTAKFLAQALGGELESAVLLGNRRIELAYRQARDQHYLNHFLKRREQTKAFLDLINGQDDIWALHYIGMGGVGKTMLLRYITACLAPEEERVTCRVDFDRISPDYPLRRPAQLLIELADELQSYISSDQQDYVFQNFHSNARWLDELSSDRRKWSTFAQRFVSFQNLALGIQSASDWSADNPLANVRRPEFEHVIRSFSDLLRLLKKPVVIILDTAEELAKLQISGAMLPSVVATFEILERVHQAVPSLRVVFAGRRLLAQSGCGWRIEVSELSNSRTALPPHKPYLRLHEIRGFTRNEAEEYFALWADLIPGLGTNLQMQQAILDRSPELGCISDITWESPQGEDAPQRYNPFDLSLYTDWLLEDPNLTTTTISSGKTDPYIEIRIIHRIQQAEIRKLLPAIVLLRRFDSTSLRSIWDGSISSFEEAYQELSSQEWLEYQRDQTLNTTFLEVNRNFYPRLLQYYQNPSRNTLLENSRRRLSPALVNLVRTRPLSQLSVDYIDAALGLLPSEEAENLWVEVSQRIPNEADWNWARTVTERILGEEGASAETLAQRSSLRASVLATSASALTHQLPDLDITSTWSEVARLAETQPNITRRKWLKQRALAGQVAASCFARRFPSDSQLADFWLMLTEMPEEPALDENSLTPVEQLIASVGAALEALVEFAETAGAPQVIPNAHHIKEWVDRLAAIGLSNKLMAFLCTLSGRALVLHRLWDNAAQMMKQAETTLVQSEKKSQQHCWADWRAPASIRDRVRLEILRVLPLYLTEIDSVKIDTWCQEAVGRINQIDGERLISFILKLKLARQLPTVTELESLAATEYYDPNRQSFCVAHQAVPPLFVTLALGWMALGNATQALLILDNRIQQATQSSQDEASIRAAEQAKILVYRRMRLPRIELSLKLRLPVSSTHPDEEALIWSCMVVNGQQPPRKPPQLNQNPSPGTLHAWWQSQQTLINNAAHQVIEVMQGQGRAAINASNFFEKFALELDWQEMMQIARQLNISVPQRQFSFSHLPKERTECPAELEAILRLTLRALALGQQQPLELQWRKRVGVRRVAEIALEEGELLALRLPKQATYLLRIALTHFRDVEDFSGHMIAAICMTIALIQAGEHNCALDEIKKLMILYETFSRKANLFERTSQNLPQRKMLQDLSLKATPTSLNKLKHPSWEGWLVRLYCCLVWSVLLQFNARETVLARTSLEQIRILLEQNYTPPLPVELNFLSVNERQQISERVDRKAFTIDILLHSSFEERIPLTSEIEPVWLRFQRYTGQIGEYRSMTPGLRPYYKAAEDIPPEIVTFLTQSQPSSTKYLPVLLQVDSPLVGFPWEAVLTLALSSSRTRFLEKKFQFWRSSKQPKKPQSTQIDWLAAPILALCSSKTLGLILEKGWASLLSEGSRLEFSKNLSEIRYFLDRSTEDIKILHLIGTPIITRAGLQLQIFFGREGRELKDSRGGTLITPESLPVKQKHIALVVVQAEPTEISFRTKTEREQVIYLRKYAAELFAAGAQVVIMLPALPPKLTEMVLAKLAQGLCGRSVPDLQQLLQAVSTVRQTIAAWDFNSSMRFQEVRTGEKWQEEAATTTIELALDVTVFAHQNLT